jgi:assimilatory nitrate reductase catalytic subunit
MHPRLATKLGIADGQRVRVVSRRGALELTAQVVATIRPDTVFIPYHWPGDQSANRLTLRAYDPIAKIPEFKVSAVRIEKLDENVGRKPALPAATGQPISAEVSGQ